MKKNKEMLNNFTKVYIIAEAGVNHNGDIALAKQLIDGAKEAGVDCVKFQTWITEDIIDISAPKANYQLKNDGEDSSQFDMLKRLELSFDDFLELKKHAEKIDIQFLSTPDEKRSLDFLADEMKLPIIKIGSGEMNNFLFLRQVAMKGLPVILSTGMSTLADVEKAYTILKNNGCPEIAILHCTSEYPAPYDSVNLRVINTLEEKFNTVVGYSDHTEGIEISLAAVALGARIIEKHFTIDKSLPGPDHNASIDVRELKEMVRSIRNIEKSIGDGVKKPYITELETKKIVQKGLFLSEDKKQGDLITIDSLVGKRPVIYARIDEADFYIGKYLNKDLKKGSPISEKDII